MTLLDRASDLDGEYVRSRPGNASALAREWHHRGQHLQAAGLAAALTAARRCANCGRCISDPLSLERRVGSTCWRRMDAGWRSAITADRAA